MMINDWLNANLMKSNLNFDCFDYTDDYYYFWLQTFLFQIELNKIEFQFF